MTLPKPMQTGYTPTEYTPWWDTWAFKVAKTVGEQYGIDKAAQVSTVVDLHGGYIAYRVADRRPVVVDEFGHIVWVTYDSPRS